MLSGKDKKDERKRTSVGPDNDVCGVKIKGIANPRDKAWRTPKFWPGDTRDKGGMIFIRALLWNRRSYSVDAKGEWRKAPVGKPKSTNAAE